MLGELASRLQHLVRREHQDCRKQSIQPALGTRPKTNTPLKAPSVVATSNTTARRMFTRPARSAAPAPPHEHATTEMMLAVMAVRISKESSPTSSGTMKMPLAIPSTPPRRLDSSEIENSCAPSASVISSRLGQLQAGSGIGPSAFSRDSPIPSSFRSVPGGASNSNPTGRPRGGHARRKHQAGQAGAASDGLLSPDRGEQRHRPAVDLQGVRVALGKRRGQGRRKGEHVDAAGSEERAAPAPSSASACDPACGSPPG